MVNRKELDPTAGPVQAFGARLRSAREARGWTQDELANFMGYSSQHISALETARKPPTLPVAQSADAVFGFTGTTESFERAYREITNSALLEGFPEYLGLEARAAEIRMFESGYVPGPLQTREYAQVLANCAVVRGDITSEQADERVEFLIERQSALLRTPPPMIFVVLDESCIRVPIGDSDVMVAQMEHLIEFARMPNTALQIAPFSMGGRNPFNQLVHLLTLPDRSLMSYVDSQTQGYLNRELTSVLPLVKNCHQLQTEAASQADSVAMINEVRRSIT
ncbi:helix-turn-helix transcriptional regulator [Streptomyces sp. NPDC006798]|uniref:helix-turn-helix domain-containing protein n=1 Tax=Streptomyces sp. NPDC006798 TaxID=3155462 RepID=UPI0033C6C8EB